MKMPTELLTMVEQSFQEVKSITYDAHRLRFFQDQHQPINFDDDRVGLYGQVRHVERSTGVGVGFRQRIDHRLRHFDRTSNRRVSGGALALPARCSSSLGRITLDGASAWACESHSTIIAY